MADAETEKTAEPEAGEDNEAGDSEEARPSEESEGPPETEATADNGQEEGAKETGRTDEDWRSLEEELDHLKIDLALKDTYAMELSSALTKCEEELARLRAAVAQAQVELEEVTSRAGYRVLARATDVLERHEGLRRTATGVARRLTRPLERRR